ncbi:sugar transporter domain-containing protein [Phthorimaea operculella]|nr:sugar transporter domain-containing protein [Phthorimaea operculella]
MRFKTLFNKLLDKVKNEDSENQDKEEIEEDYVAKCMGSFGIYQAMVCTIAGLSRFIAMWNILSLIFITPQTDFICKQFPKNVSVEVQNSTCYDDCLKYEYHQAVFESTLISRFGLICDKAWIANFAQTALMLGVLVGSWFCGWISDRQGRRTGLRLATFLNIMFMFNACFALNYWIFICLRFLIGVASGGIFVISTVYVLEIVGSDHKESAVCWALIPDGVGEAVMAVFAYYSATWDIFLLEYCVVSAVIFLLVLILPETPRWYVAHGKIDRAIEVFTRAARWNNLITHHIDDSIKTYVEIIKLPPERPKTHHMHLFGDKGTAKKTICTTLIFIQAGIGFYGITEYINLLLPNVYLSVTILGLVQVPASLLSIYLNKVFGRRILLIAVFFVNSIAMGILSFLPKGHVIAIITGAVSLSSIIVAFAVTYIYIAELYPTPLRSTALGVADSGVKVGAMVTPFIISLSPEWVPAMILSVLPLVAIGVCILLPETKGRHLKDTM